MGLLCFLLCIQAGASSLLPQGPCSLEINYTYYTLCYEPEHRQASWVQYELTLEMVNGKQKRIDNFRKDPNIFDPVESSDYKGSGYDRGHLVPAGDMKLDYQSMSETFYMTNMSPQVPRFNQGIWAGMENQARDLIRHYGDAHVISGPILKKGLKRISSDVSIPQWYFKIIYIPSKNKMIAFLIENRDHGKAKLKDYQVSVDKIEELSGFDFFSDLVDSLENLLESKIMPL